MHLDQDLAIRMADKEDQMNVAQRVAKAAELLLTAEGFRAWLEQANPETIVGQTCSAFGCPIHNYLHAEGVKTVGVSSLDIWASDDPFYTQATTPAWAQSFIAKIDNPGDSKRDVTAQEALSTLKAVAPDAQEILTPEPDREARWLAYRAAHKAYTDALTSTREHDLLLACLKRENARRHEEMTAALDAWLAAKNQLDPADQFFADITLQ